MIEPLTNILGYQRFEYSSLASARLRAIHPKHSPSIFVFATHYLTQRWACHNVEHHMYWL